MFENLTKALTLPDLAIDFTSGNTYIKQENENDGHLIVDEPAILIMEDETILSTGKKAELLSHKVPEAVRVVRPIERGSIADSEFFEHLMKTYIKEINKRRSLFCLGPDVFYACPINTTKTNEKTANDALDAAGAKNIKSVKTLVAAQVGICGKIPDNKVTIIMNVGYEHTEIAVLSMCKIHASFVEQFGYKDFVESIVEYFRTETEFSIGNKKAEELLKSIGTLNFEEAKHSNTEKTVTGVLKRTSTPYEIDVSKTQVSMAMMQPAKQVINCIMKALEETTDDMAEDIRDTGVQIIGKGAEILGIDDLIEIELGQKTNIPDNYRTAIVDGLAILQKNDK